MSQCLCIIVTSLKLLTIVRHIILSSVMSVCVCVKENAMSQYPCNISETSHNCQIYILSSVMSVFVSKRNAMS